MKAICAGILGAVCCLNLLVFAVRAAHPKPSGPTPEQQVAALQARVEELEDNSQFSGSFRRMSVREAREYSAAMDQSRPFLDRTLGGSGEVSAAEMAAHR